MALRPWLFPLLFLVSVGFCELPAPVNLSISSVNYIHILTWEPGPGTPSTDELCFRVKVHWLGPATWHSVPGCECIRSPRSCDMSAAFPDHGESYFTEVVAILGNQSSDSAMTEEFEPRETYLDPPSVLVSNCGVDLCVSLRPSLAHLLQIYEQLNYQLTVRKTREDTQFKLFTKGLKEKIKDLEPGVEYCVTAIILDRKSTTSRPDCKYTPFKYSADMTISAAFSLLGVFVVMLLVLSVYSGFICLKVPIAHVLVSVHVQNQNQLLLPLDYDKPQCSVMCMRTPPAGKSRKSMGTSSSSSSSSSEEEADDEETEEEVGTSGGGYESRLGLAQTCLIPGRDRVSSSNQTPPLPSLKTYGDLNPTDTPENASLSVYDQQVPLSFKDEGTDISFFVSVAAGLTGQPMKLCSGELGFRSPVVRERGSTDGSSPGVNLESLTLGGQDEDEDEEKEEAELQGEVLGPSLSFLISAGGWGMNHSSSQTCTDREEEEEEEEEEEDEDDAQYRSDYMSRTEINKQNVF